MRGPSSRQTLRAAALLQLCVSGRAGHWARRGAGRARLRGVTPKPLVRTGSGYLRVYALPCKKSLKNQDRLPDANPVCLSALLQASQDLRKTQYLLEPLIVLTKGVPVRGRSPTSAGSAASPSSRLRPEQAPRGSKGGQGPEFPELQETRTFNDADCSFPQSPHRTAAWREPQSEGPLETRDKDV